MSVDTIFEMNEKKGEFSDAELGDFTDQALANLIKKYIFVYNIYQ